MSTHIRPVPAPLLHSLMGCMLPQCMQPHLERVHGKCRSADHGCAAATTPYPFPPCSHPPTPGTLPWRAPQCRSWSCGSCLPGCPPGFESASSRGTGRVCAHPLPSALRSRSLRGKGKVGVSFVMKSRYGMCGRSPRAVRAAITLPAEGRLTVRTEMD